MAKDDFNDCDCPERVPADLGPGEPWVCPKCDAEWWGDEHWITLSAPSDKEGGE